MTELTDDQRVKLDKLATYLEGLPEDYADFDMDEYIGDADEQALRKYALHNGGVREVCGTVACAVGHGPSAGILFNEFQFTEYGEPDWDLYSQQFAPLGWFFWWCFASAWKRVDNHHWGAAARIRYLLQHGKPPAGTEYGIYDADDVKLYREFDKRYAAV